MKFKAYLRAALTFAAGFMLCVFEWFGIGVILMILGLLMFCSVPFTPAPGKSSAKSGAKKAPSAQKKTYPPVGGAPAVDAYAYSGTVHQYFSALLRGCFPGFTLRENVSPEALKGSVGSAAWECTCGTANTGKFCSECGKPRPAASVRLPVDSSCAALSFVLYQNGVPAVALILCSKYEWNTEQIREAMEACRKAGIPCLRFMEDFRNRADYVTDRINSVLR